MAVRMFDVKQKEVINIRDGCRFGYVCDLLLDEVKGCVTAIVVPGPARIFGMFGRDQEYVIPWDCIRQFGSDLILVDCETAKTVRDCE